MTNLQAAVGLAQTRKIKALIAKKREIAALYNERLKHIEGIVTPIEEKWAKNVYWMYAILVDEKEFGISRDRLRHKLLSEGVDTRSFFFPMHKQPVFQKMGLFSKERYPISEYISRRGLYLPSGLALTRKQIDLVCDKIEKIRKRYT
jgi:perosamine synthetase